MNQKQSMMPDAFKPAQEEENAQGSGSLKDTATYMQQKLGSRPKVMIDVEIGGKIYSVCSICYEVTGSLEAAESCPWDGPSLRRIGGDRVEIKKGPERY